MTTGPALRSLFYFAGAIGLIFLASRHYGITFGETMVLAIPVFIVEACVCFVAAGVIRTRTKTWK